MKVKRGTKMVDGVCRQVLTVSEPFQAEVVVVNGDAEVISFTGDDAQMEELMGFLAHNPKAKAAGVKQVRHTARSEKLMPRKGVTIVDGIEGRYRYAYGNMFGGVYLFANRSDLNTRNFTESARARIPSDWYSLEVTDTLTGRSVRSVW